MQNGCIVAIALMPINGSTHPPEMHLCGTLNQTTAREGLAGRRVYLACGAINQVLAVLAEKLFLLIGREEARNLIRLWLSSRSASGEEVRAARLLPHDLLHVAG